MAMFTGHPGINKTLLSPGKGNEPDYPDGTKITFHYQTRKCDEEKTVLDDSKKQGKPLEIILGKKFKLEVWEMCVKSMRAGEVASFVCTAGWCGTYPLVAKSLRDIRSGKSGHSHVHHCGMALKEQGLGYPDLDELMKKPEPLEFILDVEKVEVPGDFKKEIWCMDENEKINMVPQLRAEGNALYKEKKYTQAAAKYAEGIGILEQLMMKEKPGDEPYLKIEEEKMPLLLNFAQCKLCEGEYYQVIEHTTEVIRKQPDNVKALFRRGKAHVGAWNPEEAKADFQEVLKLDPSLAKTVKKELQHLSDLEKEKTEKDKEKFKGKLFG